MSTLIKYLVIKTKYFIMASVATILQGDILNQPPEGEFNLCGQDIPKAQKLWMVNEILLKRSTAKKFARQYNLKPHHIRKWVEKVKKGMSLRDKQGRPPFLDETAVAAVTKFIEDNYCPPEPDEVVIKDEITSNFHQSLLRTHPLKFAELLENGHDVPVMKDVTLHKYWKRFKSNILQPEDFDELLEAVTEI